MLIGAFLPLYITLKVGRFPRYWGGAFVRINFVEFNTLNQCNCFEYLTQINLQADKDTKQPIYQQIKIKHISFLYFLGSRRLFLTRSCCFFFTLHMSFLILFMSCKTILLMTLRPTPFFLVYPSQNHRCTVGIGYQSQNKQQFLLIAIDASIVHQYIGSSYYGISRPLLGHPHLHEILYWLIEIILCYVCAIPNSQGGVFFA